MTRAPGQAGGLSERLRAGGFEVVEVPVIAIAEPADGGAALREAVARLDRYEWVVCASINAVTRWAAAIRGIPGSLPRLAVLGPGSAAAARRCGLKVALQPTRAIAEGMAEMFPDGAGLVLLVRARETRGVIAPALAAKGWTVEEVEAYRTVPATPTPSQVALAGSAHAVAFTSGSTVRSFVSAVGTGAVPPIVVCIGPASAEVASSLGLSVTAVADPHTLDGLVEAVSVALS